MQIEIREIASTTADYRDYRIVAGAVYDPSGEPAMLGFLPLSPTREEAEKSIADAKAWIDRQLDG